jgi:hypothetical protein
MTNLYADFQRLYEVSFDECPSGIDPVDISEATTLGATIGAKPNGEREKQIDLERSEAIKRVSSELAHHLENLNKLKTSNTGAPTRHANAVPESTINFLIWEMLVRCSNDGKLPPAELLELVRTQLNIRTEEKSRYDEEMGWKLESSSLYAYLNPDASFRTIAKVFDLNVSTITRWNEKYDLRKRGEWVHQMRTTIDEQASEFRDMNTNLGKTK